MDNKPQRRDVLLAMLPSSPYRNEGVRRFAREAGWNILEANNLIGGLGGWRGDGALVTLRGDPDILSLARRLRRRGIPVVDLTAEHPDIQIPRVCVDNRATGRLAASHFAERNHRNAAWFSTDWSPVHAERYAGFAEGWATVPGASGPPRRWVLREGVPPGRWNDSRAVARWFSRLLREAAKPIAIFCHEMAGAARVLAECRVLGISVPDEVALLSAGDLQMVCENQSVPISCIPMNGRLHGWEAASLLARLMDGEAPPDKPILIPPCEVTVRASTDHTAAADPLVARALALLVGNLSRPWGVAQMAEELNVMPLRLARHFLAELGRTPGEEILRQRLAAARTLLRETDLPLDQIATKCGFCHASYLCDRFRRDTGLTPHVWRKAQTPTAEP